MGNAQSALLCWAQFLKDLYWDNLDLGKSCKESPESPPLPSPSVTQHHLTEISYKTTGQLLSYVWLFETPWTAAHQASLFVTNSRSLPKLMSIESVMPSSHLILCHPLLLLPSIFPNMRVFSNESALCIRWPKYWRRICCFNHLGSVPLTCRKQVLTDFSAPFPSATIFS